MERMNKKGWLKIIEVFLAIMIILGAILIIFAKRTPQADIAEEIYESQRQILELVSKNNTLRSEIIKTPERKNNAIVNEFIANIAPISWKFSTNICELDSICANPINIHYSNVYSTEVMITSNLTDYSPKKLRLFVWIAQ
jgi:hypothetical protein